MGLKLLSLEGKRALVTGAGTGLGRQMALGLAEAGADLVICGRRREPLEETAALAKPFGSTTTIVQADVTHDADLQALREGAGQIDILLNNAGGAQMKAWTEVTLEEWRQVMALNLDAPFRLCQIFAPPMMERRWGRIINICSVYGITGGDPSRYPDTWDVPSYFAAKHGVQGITHGLAPRLAPFGVCINSLSPGMFGSEQNDKVFGPEVWQALAASTPMRRLGEADDLKAAVVFLASPGAKFVTGQNIVVDGGWTVW